MDTKRSEMDMKDVGSTLLHVQRSLSELKLFKEKMKSYLCEPTTAHLFETKERIQQRINEHISVHLTLLCRLEHKKNILNKELKRIQNQLLESKELEKGIHSYMLAVHS